MTNSFNTTKAIQRLINVTNAKIDSWYKDAEIDYDVIGSGEARVDLVNELFVVDYVENGEMKTWSTYFHVEYLRTERVDYFYDCWSEGAK